MTDAAENTAREDEVSSRERIWLAAEQLRLTAVALHGMAGSLDEVSGDLADQIERLVHRSAELMRAASRLGTSLDVSSAWGLDLLFRSAADAPVAKSAARPAREMPPMATGAPPPAAAPKAPAPDPMNESVELAPIALLTPEVEAAELPRRPHPVRLPQPSLPPPPLARTVRRLAPPRLVLAQG